MRAWRPLCSCRPAHVISDTRGLPPRAQSNSLEGDASMNNELSGKVIAVTGGFGSLGMATALTAAHHGARVVLIDSAPAPGSKLPEALVDALVLGGVDLASDEAAKQAMAAIAAKYGEL